MSENTWTINPNKYPIKNNCIGVKNAEPMRNAGNAMAHCNDAQNSLDNNLLK